MSDREPDLIDALDGERVIAFVAYPGLTPLDLVGPLQVLALLGPPYKVAVVGAAAAPMATDTPLKLVPSHTYADVPEPYALIVPGGGAGAVRAMADAALQEYLREAAAHARILGSVCTGALVLGAAGLLEGKRATTHWAALDWLKKLGAKPVQERWVEDGNCLTAAGVSAGIDWALALAARLTDEDQARLAQIMIEYDPDPPFGWIDWDAKSDFAALQPRLAREFASASEVLASRPDLVRKLGL
ncbi:MAG: DJ-1/PfpI family protein [Gammaproteobacteria bacterium]